MFCGPLPQLGQPDHLDRAGIFILMLHVLWQRVVHEQWWETLGQYNHRFALLNLLRRLRRVIDCYVDVDLWGGVPRYILLPPPS